MNTLSGLVRLTMSGFSSAAGTAQRLGRNPPLLLLQARLHVLPGLARHRRRRLLRVLLGQQLKVTLDRLEEEEIPAHRTSLCPVKRAVWVRLCSRTREVVISLSSTTLRSL